MKTWNAISALTIRDWNSRIGRSPIEIFWLVWEPSMHMFFYVAMVGLIPRRPHEGDSFALFFASGILPFFLFQRTYFRISIAINQQHLQVLNRVVFLDIIISRIIIEITLWCLNIIVVWIGIKLIGDRVTIDNFEDIMIAVAGVLALAVSWGTFCGFMLAFFSFWGKTANLVTRIMYFTSGVFYVPDQMIPFVRDIIVWSPLMHLVELFRRGVYYGYGSLLLNVYYPFLISLIFMTLAALIEDKAERRMRSA